MHPIIRIALGRHHIGTTTAIAITPALIVPALMIAVGDSIWPAVLTYHVLCLAIPLASRGSFEKAGFALADLRAWLPSTVALSVLLVAFAFVPSRISGFESLLPSGWNDMLARAEPFWLFAFYSICTNALLEEFFWRGFLLPRTGAVAGAGFFWLMHVGAVSVFFSLADAVWLTLPAFAAAVAWGWMRRRFHTLWPCVITHVAVDASILWVMSGLRA